MSLSTPVVFIIFNRPDLTEIVFQAIAQVKPLKLLIVADGPNSCEDEQKCEKARLITKRVDWECEILTNFSEKNLGCKRRVSSGLDWAFNIADEAIILEDDCCPDPSFFKYCEELLQRYRDDQKIMMISGNNYLNGVHGKRYSYYFSRYTHIWGWATWRRSWRFFDCDMALWPEIRDNGWIEEIYETPAEARYRRNNFEATYRGAIDTWDYAWSFSCLIRSGLVIRPSVNLVSNIGFGAEATHTKTPSRIANFPTSTMSFPLKHPPYILRNYHLDRCEVELLLGISCSQNTRIQNFPVMIQKFLKKTGTIARTLFDNNF